jgi:hypothetical protein
MNKHAKFVPRLKKSPVFKGPASFTGPGTILEDGLSAMHTQRVDAGTRSLQKRQFRTDRVKTLRESRANLNMNKHAFEAGINQFIKEAGLLSNIVKGGKNVVGASLRSVGRSTQSLGKRIESAGVDLRKATKIKPKRTLTPTSGWVATKKRGPIVVSKQEWNNMKKGKRTKGALTPEDLPDYNG